MREVALLERIDRAIRAGEGALAVALLAELQRSVPAPALQQERAAAAVLAACVAARNGSSNAKRETRASAERFLAHDPRSVYADRIRACCAIDELRPQGEADVEEPRGVGH
jgi:hypothetical protein